MKSWILVVLWVALGLVLGLAVYPMAGKTAVLVPAGWCAGSVLGGFGGAVFTLGSHRRDRRLRRTFSAAIGAAIVAVFLGLWPKVLADDPLEIWKVALVALAAIIVPPLTVVVCFEVNDSLKR